MKKFINKLLSYIFKSIEFIIKPLRGKKVVLSSLIVVWYAYKYYTINKISFEVFFVICAGLFMGLVYRDYFDRRFKEFIKMMYTKGK